MPDMWVHPHYNHFSLPACRCVGPRLGVVRRWRVPKGWIRAARVAAGVFFVEAIGVAGFNLDCGDRGIPLVFGFRWITTFPYLGGLNDLTVH